MAYTITGTALSTLPSKIAGTSPETVFTATKRTTILSIIAANTDNGVCQYTLALYDPDTTTSHYLYYTFSIAAHGREVFNEPFVIQSGWELRVTSNHANHLDVFVTYAEPDATIQPSGYGAYTR